MTYEQIADAVGIPVGTAKTRMRLALEKLRKELL
jgi:DNA-directed RNA polymerase specialized sigma24 family protein